MAWPVLQAILYRITFDAACGGPTPTGAMAGCHGVRRAAGQKAPGLLPSDVIEGGRVTRRDLGLDQHHDQVAGGSERYPALAADSGPGGSLVLGERGMPPLVAAGVGSG
jgi:hypothetical protein